MNKTIWMNFALALVLITSSSCKKWLGEGKTIVEGKAVDGTTGQAVPFALIQVVAKTSSTYSAGYRTKVEKQADANGEFEFSFDAERDEGYGVFGYQENRYFSGIAGMTDLKSAARNKDLVLKMKPWAWAKIKFINEYPYDTAWFYVAGSTFTYFESGYGSFRLDMQYKDTTVVHAVEGGVEGELFLSVQKGITKTESRRKYFVSSLDTTVIEIRY